MASEPSSTQQQPTSSSEVKLPHASIVDLKAELFRKQQEFKQRAALGNEHGTYVKGKRLPPGKRKKTMYSGQNPGVEARSAADRVDKVFTDADKLAASRKALEAKSQLYDKMAKAGDNAEDEDGHSLYLVDFERKYIDKAMEARQRRLNEEKEGTDDRNIVGDLPDEGEDIPDEEKWVDFVDSFGRTRRCMKKDLPEMQKIDTSYRGGSETSMANEEPDLMSADMQREMLREKWEKEQREMLENQETVYYANLQFDEQRAHGVGYYQFSKDEQARLQEMEKLKKVREDTKKHRDAKKALADKRKAMLAARLDKVRQRRLAQGKPVPEPKVVEVKDEAADLADLKEESDVTNSSTVVEESSPTKRPAIREWDLGKPDLLLPRKPEKPKSWVNPRDIRDDDFAPPSFYYKAMAGSGGTGSNITPRSSTVHSSIGTSTVIPLPSSLSKDIPASTAVPDAGAITDIPLPSGPSALGTPNEEGISLMIKSLRNQT